MLVSKVMRILVTIVIRIQSNFLLIIKVLNLNPGTGPVLSSQRTLMKVPNSVNHSRPPPVFMSHYEEPLSMTDIMDQLERMELILRKLLN